MNKYAYITENFSGGRSNDLGSRTKRFSFPIVAGGVEWECFIYEPSTDNLRSLEEVKRVLKVFLIVSMYYFNMVVQKSFSNGGLKALGPATVYMQKYERGRLTCVIKEWRTGKDKNLSDIFPIGFYGNLVKMAHIKNTTTSLYKHELHVLLLDYPALRLKRVSFSEINKSYYF